MSKFPAWRHGRHANYSLFSTKTNTAEVTAAVTVTHKQAPEAGFNAMDWSLRSRYILTDDNGNRNAESIYTYAEHVFVPQRLTMQVGKLTPCQMC